MKEVICKFCDCKKEKSKEHIWPRWLQKNIIGNTKGKFRGSHLALTRGIISERLQSGESLVFGDICLDCNNGWMADLENEFRYIYLKIQANKNKIKELTKKERNIICKWSLKTVMMINAGTNYRPIIPDSHYHHFFKYRDLPKDIKVDIAYLKSEGSLMWEQSNLTMALMNKNYYDKYDPYDLTKNSYVITMQIENLGIKVIHYSGLKEKKYSIPNNSKKSLRIWPFQKNGEFNFKNSFDTISNFHLNTHIIQ